MVVAEEDEAEGEQAEHEGVFLGFGDDRAVNPNLKVVGRAGEESAGVTDQRVAEGSGIEVANGFG